MTRGPWTPMTRGGGHRCPGGVVTGDQGALDIGDQGGPVVGRVDCVTLRERIDDDRVGVGGLPSIVAVTVTNAQNPPVGELGHRSAHLPVRQAATARQARVAREAIAVIVGVIRQGEQDQLLGRREHG